MIKHKMCERIKAKRTEYGMTQDELGSRLGVSKGAISRWEHGEVENIKRSVIAKMAEIFQVTPVWLMGYEDAENVTVTYEAPDTDPLRLIVDHKPIIGRSAELALRAELYQEAMEVDPDCLQVAIGLLRSMKKAGDRDAQV